MRNKYGYTLIELMLVIALMSIMAMSGILYYRQQLETDRVNKAALNMQTILQAANGYYADHTLWPDPNPVCGLTPPPSSDFIRNYLPNQNAQNNYGSYFCWAPLAGSTNLFWVAMPAPFNDVNIANRIAAQLPNAVTTTQLDSAQPITCVQNNPCFVRVEISSSSNNNTNNNGIAGVGNCTPTAAALGSGNNMNCAPLPSVDVDGDIHYQVQFHCPANTTAGLIATPNFLKVGVSSSGAYVLNILEVKTGDCAISNTNDVNNAHCTISITALRANGQPVTTGSGDAHGHVGASYTAFCEPVQNKNVSS